MNFTFERCARRQGVIDIPTLHELNGGVGILIPLTFVLTFITIVSKINIINLFKKYEFYIMGLLSYSLIMKRKYFNVLTVVFLIIEAPKYSSKFFNMGHRMG